MDRNLSNEIKPKRAILQPQTLSTAATCGKTRKFLYNTTNKRDRADRVRFILGITLHLGFLAIYPATYLSIVTETIDGYAVIANNGNNMAV